MPKIMQAQSVSKPNCSFANQQVTHVFQVPRVPPVHRGREERRETGDEKERGEQEESKEIEVLWDHQEKAGNKASWDP